MHCEHTNNKARRCGLAVAEGAEKVAVTIYSFDYSATVIEKTLCGLHAAEARLDESRLQRRLLLMGIRGALDHMPEGARATQMLQELVLYARAY